MLHFYAALTTGELKLPLTAFTAAIKRWGSSAHALLHFALPCRCTLCGALSPKLICPACSQMHWQIQKARCLRCALPLIKSGDTASILNAALVPPPPLALFSMSNARVCGACLAKAPAFDATFALADYAEPLAALVRALKFKARLTLAHTFAQRLAVIAQEANSVWGPPDLIVPVPLSQRRLIARGYNQAWEIARPLARLLQIPAQATLLRRIIDTPAQAQLDARARQRNVRRAFTLSAAPHLSKRSKQHLAAALKGRHIAVIDDVMTSGATLAAVAQTLKRAGAARVTNLVVLRTVQS